LLHSIRTPKEENIHVLGRITAKALLSGHPGPRCLNESIAYYAITSKEPDISRVPIEEFPGDAAAVIRQVCFVLWIKW
jgi:hypothetical protein